MTGGKMGDSGYEAPGPDDGPRPLDREWDEFLADYREMSREERRDTWAELTDEQREFLSSILTDSDETARRNAVLVIAIGAVRFGLGLLTLLRP